MPARRYPDWETFEYFHQPDAGDGPVADDGPVAGDGPVAFGADLSPASVLAAYRRGIVPLPAPDEYFRTVNEVRYEDGVAAGTIGLVGPVGRDDPYSVAWWSPDPRPVISAGHVHLGRNIRKQLRQSEVWTTANTRFGQVAEECRAGREPRWLTDPLLQTLIELHAEGWAHSIEVWLDGDLIGGAMGIGIGRVISGDSLFSRYPGAGGVAVADMAARLGLAGGLLIDAQWDSPFLRSLGAGPLPRERYLRLLDGSAERTLLPGQRFPARRLLAEGPGSLRGRRGESGARDLVGWLAAVPAGLASGEDLPVSRLSWLGWASRLLVDVTLYLFLQVRCAIDQVRLAGQMRRYVIKRALVPANSRCSGMQTRFTGGRRGPGRRGAARPGGPEPQGPRPGGMGQGPCGP
jgi:leucyl/phenylalanyl-tRNA--protein transferase